MGKPIAVLGCTLMCDNPTAQATIITPPSVKVMASNKGCYKGVLQVQVVGATQGTFAQTAPMVGTIMGTGAKTMIDNMPAVLMGDKSMLIMVPLVNSAPPPAPPTLVLPVTVTILDAGQVKAMGS